MGKIHQLLNSPVIREVSPLTCLPGRQLWVSLFLYQHLITHQVLLILSYLYVHMCLFMCECARAHVHSAHRPGQHQESFSISPLIPKTRPPHWTWSSSIGWLGWFPVLSKDPLLPILPQCWDVNLGPYTFTANTLPTMPLPSSRTLSILHQASYTSKVTTLDNITSRQILW